MNELNDVIETKEPPTLFATRGIPGSGKSFIAARMVKESNGDLHPISRDDIRERTFGRFVLEPSEETLVTRLQQAEVRIMLKARRSVIVHDTNLRFKTMREWYELARSVGAKFEEIPVEVDLDTALKRNRRRADADGRFVPEEVIKDKYLKFTPKGKLPPLPDFSIPTVKGENGKALKVYQADPSLPEAWIFDMDGTVALFDGLRSAYEFDKVSGDIPNPHVMNLLRMVKNDGVKVIITSGREDSCFDATAQWLKDNGVDVHEMFMRAAGDKRSDAAVKYEIFNKHIRDRYNITGVVDDRMSVCRLWFDMKLPLFKVGDPELVF